LRVLRSLCLFYLNELLALLLSSEFAILESIAHLEALLAFALTMLAKLVCLSKFDNRLRVKKAVTETLARATALDINASSTVYRLSILFWISTMNLLGWLMG
jgi:hypothetical protein